MAYIAQNPYNSFVCHKTTVSSDDDDGERHCTPQSKICAGFLSLQHNENGETLYDEDGFEPSPLVYESSYEMSEAYERED